jgi:hypothetical protein
MSLGGSILVLRTKCPAPLILVFITNCTLIFKYACHTLHSPLHFGLESLILGIEGLSDVEIVVLQGGERCKSVSMFLYMHVADRHTINAMHV